MPDRTTCNHRASVLLVAAAFIVGALLVLDVARSESATYDEVTYLCVATRWWRTGDQESITRMGSPLGFWKYQQAPTLWVLDRVGRGAWIDDPDRHIASVLPWMRAGAIWIWAIAFGVTSAWSRRLSGAGGMVFSAWLFALSPNLIAHGALITMEMPLIAGASASGLAFSIFLTSHRSSALIASAVLAGFAFTCKFTAVLIPFLFAFCWLAKEFSCPENRRFRSLLRVGIAMSGFVVIMIATDLLLTGFALLPLSERLGQHPSLTGRPPWIARWVETPIPQDWVGFATQMRHQKSGGPSYLLGETRQYGWRYYYLIAMAAKLPLVLWGLILARAVLIRRRSGPLLVLAIGAFLLVTSMGSSRNYGVRYLLPVAPLAIVWISSLADDRRMCRTIALAGILCLIVSIATTHPRELAYFPQIVGGAEGGRKILSDSNLDWGQGLLDLAAFQKTHPEFRDLTLFYFGLANPASYGVEGKVHMIDAGVIHPGLPPHFSASTRYVAVSASLQFGPWGPPGYFDALKNRPPAAHLPDYSISIYETEAGVAD